MTDEILLKKAGLITAKVNELKILGRLIENMEYSKIRGDVYVIHHQIETGILGEIYEHIGSIGEQLQEISDDICPD